MGKFSQKFVAYHGCGNCYQDGPNKIVPKNRRCIMQTYHPFLKKTMDVRNRVEARAKFKIKTKANIKFQCRYRKWVDSLTSDDWDFTSDWESYSDSESSDTDISLANNASETEQNLSDNKLIIDIKTEQNVTPNPESLANNITEYKVSTSNNSESFNETSETADNK